jgi:hypothetical protein
MLNLAHIDPQTLRRLAGNAKKAGLQVVDLLPGLIALFNVDSESEPGESYQVTFHKENGQLYAKCTCKAGKKEVCCKHVGAAAEILRENLEAKRAASVGGPCDGCTPSPQKCAKCTMWPNLEHALPAAQPITINYYGIALGAIKAVAEKPYAYQDLIDGAFTAPCPRCGRPTLTTATRVYCQPCVTQIVKEESELY